MQEVKVTRRFGDDGGSMTELTPERTRFFRE
jgi:hypothetical protein